MKQFVQLFGTNKEAVTINLNYLIRFQPNKDGTDIWLFDGEKSVHYLVTISYSDMNDEVFKPLQ